jgi:arylsulfatase A-like enzyme
VNYIGQHAAAAKAGKPFFLYVPLTSPHTPILPTPDWQGRSGLGAYGDFVMQTDAVVGRILAALDEHGLAAQTLVIFTADNGCSPAAGTPALEKQGHFASGEFRGYKADIWEGGHRVPFLVRWPGRIKPASTSAQLIGHSDLLATCADLLGARLPANAGEDSVSVLPALLGTDRSPLREAVVHHSIHGMFSLRQGAWKLALCPGSGGWAAPKDAEARQSGLPEVQLYDLAADPAETRNVHAENPAVVARLRALLERYVADGRSTPGPKQANDVAVQLLPPAARTAKE